MNKIVQLKSYNSEGIEIGDVYPVTKSEGILLTNGKHLEEKLSEIDEIKENNKNFSAQLETKANKNEIFSMTNMGQDIKEAMTGGSVAVVGKNAILTENIVDEQVTFEKVKKGTFEVLKGINILGDTISYSDKLIKNVTSDNQDCISVANASLDFQKYGIKTTTKLNFTGNSKDFNVIGNYSAYNLYFDVDLLDLRGKDITIGGLMKVIETTDNMSFSINLLKYNDSNQLISNTPYFNSNSMNFDVIKGNTKIEDNCKFIEIKITTGFPYTTQNATIEVGNWYIAEGNRIENIFTRKEEIKIVGTNDINVIKNDDTFIIDYTGSNIVNTTDLSSELFSDIYVIGDSLSAGTLEFNTQFSWWTSQKLGKNIVNKGIWGNYTSQVLERIENDVIVNKPSHCILLVGTNDINGNLDFETTKNNVIAITDKLINANIRPIWISVPPRADKVELLPQIRKYNYFLYNLCVNRNIPFIDIYNVISNNDGTVKDGILLDTDKLHWKCKGASICGFEVAKIFRRARNNINNIYFNGDDENIVINKKLIDNNGDGKADNWNFQGNFSTNINFSIESINGVNFQVIEKINNTDCYCDFTQNLSVEVGKTYRLETIVDYTNNTSDGGLVSYIVFINSSGDAIGNYNFIIPSTEIDRVDMLNVFNQFTVPTGTVTTQLIYRLAGKQNKILKIGGVNIIEI